MQELHCTRIEDKFAVIILKDRPPFGIYQQISAIPDFGYIRK